MRVLRSRNGLTHGYSHGFTLTEFIIVAAIASVAVAAVIFGASRFVGGARETALKAEARTVLIAAEVAVLEIPASDEDYVSGLRIPPKGTLSPTAERIAQKMSALLEANSSASDIENEIPTGLALPFFRTEPLDGTAEFTVENGKITKLVYTATSGNRTFEIIIEN